MKHVLDEVQKVICKCIKCEKEFVGLWAPYFDKPNVCGICKDKETNENNH